MITTLDESVDNSVATMDDHPVTEMSLEQQPDIAYIPRGEIRGQDMTSPPTEAISSPADAGADDLTLEPVALDMITPTQFAKTQLVPDTEEQITPDVKGAYLILLPRY